MEEKDKELIKTIAEHYGYDSQSMQCIEECAELIQAINKFRRSRGIGQKTNKDDHAAYMNIVEEIADVEVMIEQLIYLLKINREAINSIKKQKLNRTICRMMSEPSIDPNMKS